MTVDFLRSLVVFSWVLVLFAAPSRAVLIDSYNGDGNTSAPLDDPGWAHVGDQGFMSNVYLGDGWVLTVEHAIVEGVSSTFRGVAYEPVLSSLVHLTNHDGTKTDLQLFRIDGYPNLPRLRIRSTPPAKRDAVVMIGHGRDRGAERRDLFRPFTVRDGWEWIPETHTKRWGTNQIAESGLDVAVRSLVVRHFITRFDRGLPTPHEANGTVGDSGGGVFIKFRGTWELAGIIFANDTLGSPHENLILLSTPPALRSGTYCVDLSHYRDQILRIMESESSDANRSTQP